MQHAQEQYHPHRHWNSTPAELPRVDAADAQSDREDSLSERSAHLLGEVIGVFRLKSVGQWPVEAMARGYELGLKRPAHHAGDYQRRLLTLRVDAYARGLPVSSALTVDLLKDIAVAVCPVSGATLAKSTHHPAAWSISRLVKDLGYVPGNVCVLSTRVNRLKDAAPVEELLGHAAWMVCQHGEEGLHRDAGNGLSALELFRLAALASGPAAWAAGKMGRLPPLAAAPTVWATPTANLAIVHVECARAGAESSNQQVRERWLKTLGADVWDDSNRLVMQLAAAIRNGCHPCDVWLEPAMASALEDLLDAMFSGQLRLPAGAPQLLAAIQDAIAPIRHYQSRG